MYALISIIGHIKMLLVIKFTSWHDPGHNFVVKIGTENTLQREERSSQTAV